jgi:iron(III) transport system ATP-binding protein
MKALIEISNLEFSFSPGTSALIENLSLRLFPGEIVCFMGVSGAGKSTLLRLAAGLEIPQKGTLTRSTNHISFIYQDYGLFPHLNVSQNVMIHELEKSRKDLNQAAASWLDLVGLKDFGLRRVDQLSGGQKQRVALARAFARQAELNLWDEPLCALDRTTKADLIPKIKTHIKSKNAGLLLVTHDFDEALALADRILYFEDTAVVFEGNPAEFRKYIARWSAESN